MTVTPAIPSSTLLIFILVFLTNLPTSIAQFSPYEGNWNQLLKESQYCLSVETLFQRAKTTTTKGELDLNSPISMGAKLNLHYIFDITPYYTIESGLGMGLTGYQYNFKDLDTPNGNFKFQNKDWMPFFSIPFKMVGRLPINKSWCFFTQMGVSLHLQPTFEKEIEASYSANVSDERVFKMRLLYSPLQTVYLGGNLDLGFLLQLPNQQILRLGITTHINLHNLPWLEGRFQLIEYSLSDSPKVIATGIFTAQDNYLGVELGYIFTNRKKKTKQSNNHL